MSDPPTNIRALQAEQVLEVTWPDSRVDRFPYLTLRAECPCASCRNEWTGERMLDPQSIRPDLKLVGMENIGTYAVQFCLERRPFVGDLHVGNVARSGRSRPRSEMRSRIRVAAHQPGPVLTVAIPTCNGAGHLAEAIQSILSQDGVEFDLIVSDDRSDDETLTIVRNAAGDRARIEVNSERLGLAGNWNRCAALARTPLVAIFHQDDVMLPGHLSAHRALFDADDSIGLTASASVVIDEAGRAVSPGGGRAGGCRADRPAVPAGSIRSLDGGRQPAALLGGDLAHGRTRRSRRLRPAIAATWSTGIAGCGSLGNGRSRGWRGRPFKSAGIPPARPIASRQGWPISMRRLACWKRSSRLDLKDDPEVARLRPAAHDRLARAFLNRARRGSAHRASGAGAEALLKGLRCSPRADQNDFWRPHGCASRWRLWPPLHGCCASMAEACRESAKLTLEAAAVLDEADRSPNYQFRLINRNRLFRERISADRGCGGTGGWQSGSFRAGRRSEP